jgi:hypothetical protein
MNSTIKNGSNVPSVLKNAAKISPMYPPEIIFSPSSFGIFLPLAM